MSEIEAALASIDEEEATQSIDANYIDIEYDDEDVENEISIEPSDDTDSDDEPIPESAPKAKKEKLPVKKAPAVEAGPAEGRETLYLLPSELTLDPKFDVRPYQRMNGDSAAEQALIEELATSLDKDGQFNPVLATRDPAKTSRAKPIVVSGHRRFKAANLLNETRSAKGKPLFRLRVEFVDWTDALRVALLDNLQRKQMSLLDLAMVVERIKLESPDKKYTTRSLASYLRVSQPTLVQAGKLLADADETTRDAVHEGRISADSALNLLKLPKEQRLQTLAKAEEIQEVANQRKSKLTPPIDGKRAVDGNVKPSESEPSEPSKSSKGESKGESTAPSAKSTKIRIEAPAIAQAIREVAPEKAPKRTRREILDFFMDQDCALNGYKNGAVRQFVAFLAKWADNAGTDKTLQTKFDAMVEKAPKGTKTKADELDETE